MEIQFDTSVMGYQDKESMGKVIRAYMRHTDEEIMCTGMNMNTGYVYIALENGITIASNFGQKVEYIVTDFEDGEEYFLDTYRQAERKVEQLN
jgi:hypothetical protein